MFMYLRCDKKKNKILQMESFLFPVRVFSAGTMNIIGSKIKKRGEYNEAMGLRSGLL